MSSPRWSEQEVLEALGIREGAGELEFGAVSTDTRQIAEDDLFVALVGDKFDAHLFLAQAADDGATGAVVEHVPDDAPRALRYFVVENTLHALGRLARYRRQRLAARVVGVVGSNGKTTTKDLIRTALSARFRVHATEGNLNNQIGTPLTILRAPADAEALVVEMGTNEPGEIGILRDIVQPDAAVITSIGEEHLEKLVDLAGVLEEESAILQGNRLELAVVAEEPPELAERARQNLRGGRVLIAGFSDAADLRPDDGRAGVSFREDGSTEWSWKGNRIRLPLPGRYNVRNALLALGLAESWGVPPADAARALESMPAPSLRGEWKRIGEMRVLADCYNSNPPGVEASVEVLVNLPEGGRKIAVLGTMRELGEGSSLLHDRTAESVVNAVADGLDLVVATGDFSRSFRRFAGSLGDRLVVSEDPIEAFALVAPTLSGNETILLKASRGEELERWLPLLEELSGTT